MKNEISAELAEKIKAFKDFMTKYKYDETTCNQCELFSEERCRFSQSFIEGCKSGRAMMCFCRECVIKK